MKRRLRFTEDSQNQQTTTLQTRNQRQAMEKQNLNTSQKLDKSKNNAVDCQMDGAAKQLASPKDGGGSTISANKPGTDARDNAATLQYSQVSQCLAAATKNNNNTSTEHINNPETVKTTAESEDICKIDNSVTPEVHSEIKANYNHRKSIDSYYYNLFQNPPNNTDTAVFPDSPNLASPDLASPNSDSTFSNLNTSTPNTPNLESPNFSRKFSYYHRLSISNPTTNKPTTTNMSNSKTFDFQTPRHRIINEMVQKRRSEYETSEPFSIYCGTWNTNGQMPGKEEGVTSWLGQAKDSFHASTHFKKPDIYALGFQELDLSKEAYIRQDSFYEKAWLEKIEDAEFLRTYDRIKCVRLVGIMLVIYVKRSRKKDIDLASIHHCTVGTGLMNTIGNKGGVAISMKIRESSVCFIGAHFAAHVGNVERRNADYTNIIERSFRDNFDGITLPTVETPEICINNHDIILWVGDLNYRLDPVRLANVSQTDENELKVKLQEVGMKEIDRLQFIRHLLDTSDQLNICKKENRVFGGYKEAEIQFVPSYKFDHNTNRYDSSEKARVPAWTDRILWRDTAGQVKCQYYGVHMDHMISDHKPVSAQLYVDISTQIKSKYQKVYQEEIQKQDKLENEERPSCNLGVHELDFGTMFFRESKSLSIDVKNTGRVAIMFSIGLPSILGGMNSPDSSRPKSFRHVNLPDWLKIDLDRADAKIIMPGESKTVRFTIFVNEYSVRKLNIGEEELNCILVFHMVNGGDQFISINGNFKPTVYGLNLVELSRLKNTPIASLNVKQVKSLVTASNFEKLSFIQEFTEEQNKSLWGVPKEFHKLCSRLDNVESAKINKEIFLKNPPSMDEAARVRTALDNQTMDEELPGGKLISQHGIAEQLLIFLSVLPERVIPQSYYKEIIKSAGSVETVKAMLDKLPLVHKQCFLRLIRTLKILLDNQTINTLSLEFVGTLFNSLLFVPPTSMAQNHDYDWDWSKNQSKQFLLYYLEGKINLLNSIVVNTSQTSSNSPSLIEFD